MKVKNFAIILVILAISLSIASYNVAYMSTEAVVTTKVLKTERVITGSGDSIQSKYLVFCENETFELTDSLMYGKFNSSDMYGSLQVGKTYTFKVVGWRNHFFSIYRNIISMN
jgi:hypothetical protein